MSVKSYPTCTDVTDSGSEQGQSCSTSSSLRVHEEHSVHRGSENAKTSVLLANGKQLNMAHFSPGRRLQNDSNKIRYYYTSKDLQTDASTFDVADVGDEIQYRHKLKEIDEELVRRDIETLKFLCRDVISSSTLEGVNRGIDLFAELESKDKLGPLNLKFLAECLLRIQRADLLRKLGINLQEFEDDLLISGEELSPYRKMLLDIADDLTKKELSTLCYVMTPHLRTSRIKAGKIKSAFELFVAVEHSELMSEDDVTFLINSLHAAGRTDLVAKVNDYQETVSGISVNRKNSRDTNDFDKITGEDEFLDLSLPQTPPVPHQPPPAPGGNNGFLTAQEPRPAWFNSNGHRAFGEPDQNNPTCIPVLAPSSYFPSSNRGPVVRAVSGVGQSENLPSFIYGPNSDLLENVAVNSGEAQIHRAVIPQEPVPIMPCQNFEQGRLIEEMRRMQMNQDEMDLPCYKMNVKPRGYCLIINNKTFYKISGDNTSREMPNRDGTQVDADNLTQVFHRLGFLVEQRNDLTDTDMVRVCTEIALRSHEQFDCFACCILTHGVKDRLYGTNGRLTFLTDITSCFKAQRCPSLRGKPKLFFIQACQGKEKQIGYGLETDAPDDPVETIPNEADFLIGYATVPGFVSYRSKTRGSWYITKLVEMLDKYASRYDLLSIMIKVNEEVNQANASIDGGRYKQSPAPMPTLRKKIYFR